MEEVEEVEVDEGGKDEYDCEDASERPRADVVGVEEPDPCILRRLAIPCRSIFQAQFYTIDRATRFYVVAEDVVHLPWLGFNSCSPSYCCRACKRPVCSSFLNDDF